jgi:Domain of unknown function (DUF4386)
MNVQNYARAAGVLFLLSLLAGGFGEAYVPSKLILSSDAAATASNITAFDLLFRAGFAGFSIESVSDVTLSLIFYVLLKPINKQLSLLAAFLGLVGTTVFAVAELFYFMPLHILGGAHYLKAFSPDQLNSLALLSLKFYGYGAAIFTVYYGLAWAFRGYLIFESGCLPKFLGILMVIGGIGFVARNFLLILAPAYASGALLLLMFSGGLMLTGWLLIRGVDASKWDQKQASLEATGP